jgi:multicomponent K+:H+ antiporter subunit A
MSLLSLVVLLPLVAGTVLCGLSGRDPSPAARARTAWLAAAITAAALGLLLSQAPAVLEGQTLLSQTEWLPAIGLNIGWRLDGLALMFGLLITGIGLLIILYAAWYLHEDDPAGKFFALLMLFMAAMLGIVLSDNLLLLVVFWELTSVSSFLLVGYWGSRAQGGAEARAGARMALAVTGGGGLVLLAGVLVLGHIGGSFALSELLSRGDEVRSHALYPLALGLILVGCFTKSAQWPFHFWLPEAMAAPTPVSAYLHSATMVKAGIFLLARLYPVIGGTELFQGVVATTGLLTMAVAAYVAVFKHDLKGLLAYSTISHLGLIVFLLGLASPLSSVAAMFHILNHATFKAALFMTAGIVDHETGTRDMRRLGGLMRYLPWTGTLAMVAAAAMAGVPLANGFLSKEMFFDEAVRAQDSLAWGVMVPLAATFGGICSVAYSLRFVHDVFFNGQPVNMPKPHPHEPPWMMKAPVALLAVVCVVVGLVPALTFGPMVHVAATAVLGAAPPQYKLAIWHGFNLPLAMSAVALVLGVGFYLALQRHFNLHGHHPRGLNGRVLFTHAINGLFGLAGWLGARLDIGSLQRHASWMVGAAVVAAAWPWLAGADLPATGNRTLMPADALSVVVWLLLLATGAALVLGHRNRVHGVVLAGVVGLITSLCFVALSAPDLALTQLSVEVVSSVLLLMGLALLPATSPRESSVARRSRDALLALAGGGGIAWLSWLMLTRDYASISWYFLENAISKGGGSNVVNVILVDYRGYDTFGEITVLGIAGIGVAALLHGWRVRRPGEDGQGRPWQAGGAAPLLLRFAARLVLPLALVVTVYIFWRGHNLPGGGFIAGLITAVALVLQYIALGQARAEQVLKAAGGTRFVRWVGMGLGIAWLTGVGALVFGRPFLTSAFGHPVVPLLGELPLATAALFDLGVYITVVGATMLTLSVLGGASKEGAQHPGKAAP